MDDHSTDYEMDDHYTDGEEDEVQYVYPDGEEEDSDDDGLGDDYDGEGDGMFHSLDEDEDHEGVEDDIDEEIDGDGFDVEGAIPAAFGGRRVRVATQPAMNLQELLGTLSQHMGQAQQNRRNTTNTGDTSTPPANATFSDFISMFSSRMAREGGTGSRNSRMVKLVENIANASEDSYIAMESLREISENLLMTNQLLLDRIIPMDELLVAVIDILKDPMLSQESELQVQACRCLHNLYEVNIDSMSSSVDQNIIQILQDKLQQIDFIDLAEQVLETLEYLSRIQGKDICRNGEMSIYIRYYDFFTVHAQRKAVYIVTNALTNAIEADFVNIKEVFPSLTQIFMNTNDSNVISHILNAYTGVCRNIKNSDQLVSLFLPSLFDKILQILSNVDSQLEDKLKCINIMTLLVSQCLDLKRHFLRREEPVQDIMLCLNVYAKNNSTKINDKLMFVPKKLLLSVTRFITALLPSEEDSLLSNNVLTEVEIDGSNIYLDRIFKDLTPLLIELYGNTTDFEMKEYVLVCMARISTHTKQTDVQKLCKHLLPCLASILSHIQNNDLLATSLDNIISDKQMEQWILCTATLSILRILLNKFGDVVANSMKREGINIMINSISEKVKEFTGLNLRSIELKHVSHDNNEDESSDSDSANNEDNYDISVPDYVKPKAIKFNLLSYPSPEKTLKYLELYCDELTDIEPLYRTNSNEELDSIKQTINFMADIEVETFDAEKCDKLWRMLYSNIFGNDEELSGFEMISTGLGKAVATLLEQLSNNYQIRKSFEKIFSSKAINLVTLLQSTLNRVENFPIIDSGISGESGVSLLTKLLKLELVIDENLEELGLPKNLETTNVQIHCIATYTNLKDFIKQRFLKVQFLDNLLPNSSIRNNESNPNSADALDSLLKEKNMEFYFEDYQIDSNDTIFGGLLKAYKKLDKSIRDVWQKSQRIKVKFVSKSDKFEETQGDEKESISRMKSSTPADHDDPALDILKILKFLHNCSISAENFVNTKLSSKLARQLDEPLIVLSIRLPEWATLLTKEFSFLFPFETRMFALQCISFDQGRLIQLWKSRVDSSSKINTDEQLEHLGRVVRHKLRIPRKDMFSTGVKVLKRFGGDSTVMEVEYIDEVGTGLGPTLEFYAIISKEFARKSLNMWHCLDDNMKHVADGTPNDNTMSEVYVLNPLFPAPMIPEEKKRDEVLDLFNQLGVFVARSLYDNRILDFRFNPVFFMLCHAITKNEGLSTLTLDSDQVYQQLSILANIDSQLAASLRYIYNNRTNTPLIKSLSLTFTLPGYNFELVEHGNDHAVDDLTSVEKYISLVLDMFLGTGIAPQLNSFIDGFSRLFPYKNMLLFSPNEIADLFGRVEEDWSPETLFTYLVADHGYTMDSPTIRDLISIISTFDNQEKRMFLKFLTGSPKLPLGGFKSLKPKLTVVLKHAEDGLQPDDYLPSVMTCANYLKLPKYSSREVMRQQILTAMTEGADSFQLS